MIIHFRSYIYEKAIFHSINEKKTCDKRVFYFNEKNIIIIINAILATRLDIKAISTHIALQIVSILDLDKCTHMYSAAHDLTW